MLAHSDSLFLFPQHVDESFNTAEEEPSQATEDFDPGQFASEGKPTFKTQPNVLHFYILYIMYLPFMYYYIRVGIIVVVLGQTPHTLYLSGDSELEQPWWICVLLSHYYPSTCTCRIAALLD